MEISQTVARRFIDFFAAVCNVRFVVHILVVLA